MAAYMRKTGILPVCTNNEARDYFAGKGLTADFQHNTPVLDIRQNRSLLWRVDRNYRSHLHRKG